MNKKPFAASAAQKLKKRILKAPKKGVFLSVLYLNSDVVHHILLHRYHQLFLYGLGVWGLIPVLCYSDY
jgi:hypothetical protein